MTTISAELLPGFGSVHGLKPDSALLRQAARKLPGAVIGFLIFSTIEFP